MISFTSHPFKHLSEKRCVKKIQDGHHNWLCKITSNTQEMTLSWKLFREIIWNRGIITARCSNDRTKREIQDENVLLNFKVFEKIKQVSSTKLTNWYKKNISRWKTNKFFHRLIFLGANPKVSKYCSRASEHLFRKKTKNYFSGKS